MLTPQDSECNVQSAHVIARVQARSAKRETKRFLALKARNWRASLAQRVTACVTSASEFRTSRHLDGTSALCCKRRKAT